MALAGVSALFAGSVGLGCQCAFTMLGRQNLAAWLRLELELSDQ